MEKLIYGVHHIALNCADEKEYAETLHFYSEILGLELLRKWNNGIGEVTMLSAGNTVLEIFSYAESRLSRGTIRHFAFAVHDTDKCVEVVRKSGYPVIVEPKNVTLHSEAPLNIRVAFCNGPVGEEIEFFQTF